MNAPAGGYPKEVREEAARLRAAGMTYDEISAVLRIKKVTLASWFTRRTFAPLPRPPRVFKSVTRWGAETVEEAKRLRSQGATLAAIAERLACPISTVQSWLADTAFAPSACDRACNDEARP